MYARSGVCVHNRGRGIFGIGAQARAPCLVMNFQAWVQLKSGG